MLGARADEVIVSAWYGGVGSERSAASTSCSWISRARSISVPRKTLAKPLMEVTTAGGTDWERVWLTIWRRLF